MAGIASWLEDVEVAGVLVEAALTGAIDRHGSERGAENPLGFEAVGHAEARLEVV